jgi:hypothetical protein
VTIFGDFSFTRVPKESFTRRICGSAKVRSLELAAVKS